MSGSPTFNTEKKEKKRKRGEFKTRSNNIKNGWSGWCQGLAGFLDVCLLRPLVMLFMSAKSTTRVPSKTRRLHQLARSPLRFLHGSVDLLFNPHLPLTLGRVELISNNKHRQLRIL